MPNPWLNEHKSMAAMNYFLILFITKTRLPFTCTQDSTIDKNNLYELDM
jgi:hypothetical protein